MVAPISSENSPLSHRERRLIRDTFNIELGRAPTVSEEQTFENIFLLGKTLGRKEQAEKAVARETGVKL